MGRAAARAIYTIWLRDVKRFFRERSRIVGMMLQPILFLVLVGNGIASSFRMAGAPAGFNYLEFMFPGIVGMTVLFSAVFSAMSVVWDREFGFLKEVVVAPVPRWTLAIGKALGGSTTAVIQGAIILIIAPLAGVSLTITSVVELLALLFVISLALASLGLVIAANLSSMEGFQIIMNFLIMPMFFLSGALFPLKNVAAWMAVLTKIDPLTYGVDALRHVIYGESALGTLLIQFPLLTDLSVVMLFGAVLLSVATVSFNRTA